MINRHRDKLGFMRFGLLDRIEQFLYWGIKQRDWRMFLHSLRFNMNALLRRGISVSIWGSFKCTLDCPYCCVMYLGHKRKPQDPPHIRTFEEWRDWILRLPFPIRHVNLTGGEPMMQESMISLANWLTARRIPTFIYTNMTTSGLLKVNPSPWLRMIASYHESCGVVRFLKNYYAAKKIHRNIVVEELETQHLPFSRQKALMREPADAPTWRHLRAGPDTSMVASCHEVSTHYMPGVR